MPKESIRMSKQVRPSELEVVSLDDSQERRFRKLEEEAVMIDLHEHPMVKPEDPNLFLNTWVRAIINGGMRPYVMGGLLL